MTEQFERAKTLFFEGIGHFEAGRFEAAEAAFAASLACVPGRASTLANLGAARTRLGRWNAALDVLDQALALEPTDVDAESHRGIAHAALGRHAERWPATSACWRSTRAASPTGSVTARP